jgi:DNA-binding NarL/FixJ family response regulator
MDYAYNTPEAGLRNAEHWCHSGSALLSTPRTAASAAIPTILAIDDHELFRMGLRAVLDESHLEPTALLEADCLRSGIELYRERRAAIQLVVLDLNLPDSKGLSALEMFRRAHPEARIIALSESFDPGVAEEARALGALEVLHKACGVAVFRQITGFAAGRSMHNESADIHPTTHARVAPCAPGHGTSIRLTPRQLEILDLVLQGNSNQEIGNATGLKIGTVKNHISWLLVVFAVTSRSRLISLFR